MPPQIAFPVRFIPYQQLKTLGIPYSRMHVDRLEKAGKFPKRVHLSKARVAWLEAEIAEWQAGKIAGRETVMPLRGNV